MKKTIIPIILVMLLGWVLVGCGPEEFDPSLPDGLKEHLGNKSIKLPKDTNFHDWIEDEGVTYIAWSDADEAKWTAYVKDTNATLITANVRAVQVSATHKASINISGTNKAQIEYYADGGYVGTDEFVIPSGSIVLWYY